MGGYSRDFAGAVQATNEMSGAMTAETFITVIILSLGMSAPIVAAFNFVDTLAQVGTTVAQVDEILKAEEQTHSETPVTFDGHSIEFRDVSFGYHDDKEILHGVSLTIPQNGMTALVGPSGSGKSTLAKLAAGFWDVKTGNITMGGHDLRDIPLRCLRFGIKPLLHALFKARHQHVGHGLGQSVGQKRRADQREHDRRQRHKAAEQPPLGAEHDA